MKELVVARFEENLNWLHDVPEDIAITVYDKHFVSRDFEVPSRSKTVKLWNDGREAHSYLCHIVANYDRLADWTYFVQGTPHADDLVARIQANYSDSTSLTTMYAEDFPPRHIKDLDLATTAGGFSVRYGDARYAGARQPWTNGPWLTEVWGHFFSGPQPDPWWFGYGAEWAVPRHRIRARPLSFWRWCLLEVSTWENNVSEMAVASPWAMELIWYYLFSDATTYPLRLTDGLERRKSIMTGERRKSCCG